MPVSWADSVSVAENAAASASSNHGELGTILASTRSTYVPPHLRNKCPSSEPPAPESYGGSLTLGNDRFGHAASLGSSRWVGSRNVYNRSGYASSRSGGGDLGRDREINPFEDVDTKQPFAEQENTGINVDALKIFP